MLEKNYNPKDFEEKIYADWENSGDFKPDMREGSEAFSVVIPPPNVTGYLHMGHALNDTLQDILVRYNRMQGKNVLWQPGTDHAGIATQMVVERNLSKDGISRHDLGREKFIETVWKWKEHSGGTSLSEETHMDFGIHRQSVSPPSDNFSIVGLSFVNMGEFQKD